MINIRFTTEFSEEEIEQLHNFGVLLEDMDYALIIEYEKELFNADNSPKEYKLKMLLVGCYNNIWHRLVFEGKEVIIGIAYHG